MRLSLQPPPDGRLSPSPSNNLAASNSQSPTTHVETPYLDPYTTSARPRTARWRLALTRLSSSLHKKSRSIDSSSTANSEMQQQQRKQQVGNERSRQEAKARPVASLTERNLNEFFNPDYCDTVDVFREDRENPYDNSRRRSRVGEWIRGLPE